MISDWPMVSLSITLQPLTKLQNDRLSLDSLCYRYLTIATNKTTITITITIVVISCNISYLNKCGSQVDLPFLLKHADSLIHIKYVKSYKFSLQKTNFFQFVQHDQEIVKNREPINKTWH